VSERKHLILFLVIVKSPEHETCDVEAETRMQRLIYNVSNVGRPAPVQTHRNAICVQHSSGSDNAAISLVCYAILGRRAPEATFIMMRGKHVGVRCLLGMLDRTELSPKSIVRLYCIAGSDFNHSAHVATTKKLIETDVTWYESMAT